MSQRTPCDRFYEEDPFSWYILLFEGISALGLLINCYVIYCLIWRSPKNMSTYKWYLLYHQIVALMADTGVSDWITVAYKNSSSSVQLHREAGCVLSIYLRLSDEHFPWSHIDASTYHFLPRRNHVLHRYHCAPLLVPLFDNPPLKSPASSLLDRAFITLLYHSGTSNSNLPNTVWQRGDSRKDRKSATFRDHLEFLYFRSTPALTHICYKSTAS